MREASNLDCIVEQRTDSEQSDPNINPLDSEPAFRFLDIPSVQVWANSFLAGNGWEQPLVVYSARSAGGRALGFAAFATQRVFRMKVHSLAGYYWPFRTLAVSADPAAREAFCEALASHFTCRTACSVLRFGPLSSADKGVDQLIRALRRLGWKALHRAGGEAYELSLSESPGSFEDRASPSLLKNIRYERRRLVKQSGELIVQRHELGPGSDAVLDAAARIEAASWVPKKNGLLKFVGEARRRYWRELAALPNRESKVAIWLLRCAGEAIAFSVDIETPDTVYIIANLYDEAWKAHSPGAILAYEALADAYRRGMKRVNWGQGDSGYKSRWGAKALTQIYDVMLFRPVVLGTLLFGAARRALPSWQFLPDE